MSKKMSLSFQIKDADKKHPLEEAIEAGKPPILVGVGFTKVPGKESFFSYVIKTQGDKILSITEISEGMHISGAFDATKINTIDYLLHHAQNSLVGEE